jgi:hypothetical protein
MQRSSAFIDGCAWADIRPHIQERKPPNNKLNFPWTLLLLTRQCGMFNVGQESYTVPSLDSPGGKKLECWKVWAAQEVQHRAVLSHYVLDGHISQFSGYAACARHVTNPLQIPAPDAAFDATTANE